MVSIIIPLYNRIKVFPETINSVLKQTYNNWETIIVDDQSTDGSYEYALQLSEYDKRFKVLKNQSDKKGASGARNTGIKAALGKYIIFLDSDDLLASHCLERRVNLMECNSTLDWSVFMQYKWDGKTFDNLPCYSKRTKKEEAICYFLQMDPPWQTMAPIWRRDAIESLNGFDESLLVMEDPDLHLRALLSNLNVGIQNNLSPDSYYRINNEQNSSILFYYNSIQFRIKFLSKLMTYLPRKYSANGYSDCTKQIREGFYNFCKVFLLARLNDHQQQFSEIVETLHKNKILNNLDILKLKLINIVFTSKSAFIKKTRIKGIFYNIFFD